MKPTFICGAIVDDNLTTYVVWCGHGTSWTLAHDFPITKPNIKSISDSSCIVQEQVIQSVNLELFFLDPSSLFNRSIHSKVQLYMSYHIILIALNLTEIWETRWKTMHWWIHITLKRVLLPSITKCCFAI